MSNAALYCARAISGTLPETQASYLAIYSSHSGTPTFSALDEAVLVAGVLVTARFEFPAIELLLFVVSVLLHPTSRKAHRTQRKRRLLFSIGQLLGVLTGSLSERFGMELAERGNNTLDEKNLIAYLFALESGVPSLLP